MKPPQNFLLVRTDRIGDVILSLPMAALIKKHFPNALITFLVREYTKPLVENNTFINEVITIREDNGKMKIMQNASILRGKFDACIIAFPTFRVALTLFLAGIKIRIGIGYRWYSFLFNKKVYEHRKYGEYHELEYNVRLLQQLGIQEHTNHSNVEFGLAINQNSHEKIITELESLGWTPLKNTIIFHPGSGGSAVDLPIGKMKQLIQKVSAEKNNVVIITGSIDEKKLCESLIVNNCVINKAGEYNLSELIALINMADILIANSTGPIHIAAALDKHVIGFYPKYAAVSPKRWGPYTEKAKVFQPTVCDGNCSREKCEKLNCMNSIDIQDILIAIQETIKSVEENRK
jgi:heptosyltransferase III